MSWDKMALDYRGRGSSNRPSFSRSSDTYAQDTNAWLHRQQWSDYQKRFQPVERQLIDETMGVELLDKRLGAISTNVDEAFGSAEIDANITRGRYGVRESEGQAALSDRHTALAKSTATAGARNNTRTAIYDRNMETIAGGASVATKSLGR